MPKHLDENGNPIVIDDDDQDLDPTIKPGDDDLDVDDESKLDADGNPIIDDPEPEYEIDDETGEPKLDAEGNPIEKKPVEAWMAEEDDTQDPLPDVPVATHIKMKTKLKGRLSDRDETIAELRAENEALKSGKLPPASDGSTLERPKVADFNTTEEYEVALDKYEEDKVAARVAFREQKKVTDDAQQNYLSSLAKANDEHYERAAKLLEKTGISPEVFQKADETVRREIEKIRPQQGNMITDQIIALVGEGSEKVLFYLGRNRKAMDRYVGLLKEDPSGLKSAIFIGQQRERLLGTKNKSSRAPAPAPKTGTADAHVPAKSRTLHNQYKAASKKGDSQAAYNARKTARQQGIDVSNW